MSEKRSANHLFIDVLERLGIECNRVTEIDIRLRPNAPVHVSVTSLVTNASGNVRFPIEFKKDDFKVVRNECRD